MYIPAPFAFRPDLKAFFNLSPEEIQSYRLPREWVDIVKSKLVEALVAINKNSAITQQLIEDNLEIKRETLRHSEKNSFFTYSIIFSLYECPVCINLYFHYNYKKSLRNIDMLHQDSNISYPNRLIFFKLGLASTYRFTDNTEDFSYCHLNFQLLFECNSLVYKNLSQGHTSIFRSIEDEFYINIEYTLDECANDPKLVSIGQYLKGQYRGCGYKFLNQKDLDYFIKFAYFLGTKKDDFDRVFFSYSEEKSSVIRDILYLPHRFINIKDSEQGESFVRYLDLLEMSAS